MTYHIRYIPGSDLARRFPPTSDGRPYPTREAAEEIRKVCPNAAFMEVYEVEADDLPPHTTVGQSRNGRWWSQCTRPPCGHYTSGLLTRDAALACGRVHQAQHDGATRRA